MQKLCTFSHELTAVTLTHKGRRSLRRPHEFFLNFLLKVWTFFFHSLTFPSLFIRPSSSAPLCRAPARTSWTISCTSTGLCPSPSWQFVWLRCLRRTPAAQGSQRWGKHCFCKSWYSWNFLHFNLFWWYIDVYEGNPWTLKWEMLFDCSLGDRFVSRWLCERVWWVSGSFNVLKHLKMINSAGRCEIFYC